MFSMLCFFYFGKIGKVEGVDGSNINRFELEPGWINI